MAKLPELSAKLLKRFRDVPNVTTDDADDWVERAMQEHGYNVEADVPDRQVLLVLLYAEWDATMQLALNTAYYFQYKDAEETVDKRNISEQYRSIAAELLRSYERKKAQSSGARFHVATRVDRN